MEELEKRSQCDEITRGAADVRPESIRAESCRFPAEIRAF